MGNARKMVRLFKSFPNYKSLMDMMNKKGLSGDFQDVMTMSWRLCLFLFFFFDNIRILSKIKFINFDEKANMRRAAFFELLSHISKLLINLSKFNDLNDKLAAVGNEVKDREQSQALNAQKTKVTWTILLSMIDIFVASNTVGLSKALGFKFNDGIIGAAGSISALIGGYWMY